MILNLVCIYFESEINKSYPYKKRKRTKNATFSDTVSASRKARINHFIRKSCRLFASHPIFFISLVFYIGRVGTSSHHQTMFSIYP